MYLTGGRYPQTQELALTRLLLKVMTFGFGLYMFLGDEAKPYQ